MREFGNAPSAQNRKVRVVILLLFAFAIMLLIAIIAVSWSDLVREVPVPEVVKRFEAEPVQSSTRSTSGTLAVVLIPYILGLPAFVREHRDEFNTHLARLNDLIQDWRHNEANFKTAQQAYRSYSIMREKYVRENNEFYKVWKDAGGNDETARLEFRAIMKVLDDQLADELDEINVRFGNWKAVAENNERKGNWDKAIYYWRKHGVYGQLRIVSGSVAKKCATQSSLLPIVKWLPYKGPDIYQGSYSSSLSKH